MIQVNEYFDGKVKSLAFRNSAGRFTAGVMIAGQYDFSTGSDEYITVISGSMEVKLPGDESFKNYKPFDTFEVPKNTRFEVRLSEDTAYLCRYEP